MVEAFHSGGRGWASAGSEAASVGLLADRVIQVVECGPNRFCDSLQDL